MIFSIAFIFNHASDGNSPYIGQLKSNVMTEDTRAERQGCHT